MSLLSAPQFHHTRAASLDSMPEEAVVATTPPPAAPTRKAALRRRPDHSFAHLNYHVGDSDALKSLKEAMNDAKELGE